jgi:hypothetical protein
VSEALGQEQRPAVLVIQAHRLPLAKAGRSGPQVNHDIEDGAGDAGDVLRLTGRNVRVVDAADHAAPRRRAVHLGHVEPVTQVSGEVRAAERLKERTPVVPVHLGGEYPGAFDAQRFHDDPLPPGRLWGSRAPQEYPAAAGAGLAVTRWEAAIF